MSDLVPRAATPMVSVQQRRTVREVAQIQHRTITRLGRVQSESIVQTEKLHEIDHLSREAMTGHAMLHRWASTLASGDPFIVEDLNFFLDTAKFGKGEVLADTIDTYCRESRS